MLLLFLLYIVFNTIIKAMTRHQNLQIIGKHMQMVFLTIRFLLLQCVMKCMWCGFWKGGCSWKELQQCLSGYCQSKESNTVCRETLAFISVLDNFCRFSFTFCLSQIEVISKIKRHGHLAGI